MGKRPLESVCTFPFTSRCSKNLHTVSRIAHKEFWVARIKEFPCFKCNPWNFYESFLTLNPGQFLVLCNDGTEVRTMRIFGDASVSSDGKAEFPLLPIQHPNFVDICEAYLFEQNISVIVEYVGFSIEDLLRNSIHPTEREIAFITSQVGTHSAFKY